MHPGFSAEHVTVQIVSNGMKIWRAVTPDGKFGLCPGRNKGCQHATKNVPILPDPIRGKTGQKILFGKM